MCDKKSILLPMSLIALLITTVLLSGCGINLAPTLTEREKQAFEDTKYPLGSSTIYINALSQMGTTINSTVNYRKILQSKEIGNTAGGNELPLNLTNMVISSISEFTGPRVVVVPFDFRYTTQDYQTGGKGTRVLPDVVIGGSITEFDKDIEGDSSSIDLDLLISHHGNETDIGAGAGKSKKLSRVVLDLYLLDYKTQAVIPGVHVSNTIHVLEMDKDHDLGFAIWGSGMGINGRIERKQGFHRAVRNLVEYSILQLFGKYYDLPYWQLLGIKQADPDVLRSLTKTFSGKNRRNQILEIQRWLTRYDLGPIKNPVDGKTYTKNPNDGFLDPTTQAFIDAFRKRFAPEIAGRDLRNIYIKLIENGAFPNLHVKEKPAEKAEALDKELADKKGQARDATNLILMRQ